VGPPGRDGMVTSGGSGMDKGHSQRPRSLLPDVPADDEGTLGRSLDFDHIHSD
jgi:hypothetical protein